MVCGVYRWSSGVCIRRDETGELLLGGGAGLVFFLILVAAAVVPEVVVGGGGIQCLVGVGTRRMRTLRLDVVSGGKKN